MRNERERKQTEKKRGVRGWKVEERKRARTTSRGQRNGDKGRSKQKNRDERELRRTGGRESASWTWRMPFGASRPKKANIYTHKKAPWRAKIFGLPIFSLFFAFLAVCFQSEEALPVKKLFF